LSPGRDTTITLGDAVTFRGRGADPDGEVVSHAWYFGDGDSASVQNPAPHTYSVATTFETTYIVTDDSGLQSAPARREVTVVDPGRPPTQSDSVLLAIDWDTGEVTDGGLIVHYESAGGNFEVRSTDDDGRDFSTSNYLRVNAATSRVGDGWVDMISRTWAAPRIGETITARWEMNWNTAVSGQTTHGFYFDDDFGGTNWGPPAIGLSIEDEGEHWQVGFWTAPSATPWAWGWRMEDRYPLNKGERYDFAFSYTRTGENTFTAGLTISQGGAVVFDTSDFIDIYHEVSGTLADQEFTLSGAGAQGMRGFRLGNNGLDVPFTGSIVEAANLRIIRSGP
jgi:hypothetical protein